MSNRNRLMISIALISSMLLSTITLAAQTSTSDWAWLRNLPTDSKVSVKLKTGKKIDGRLRAVSDSSLTLTSKNAPLDVKREDVASVHQLMSKSATKSTLIGLGLGAGAGAGIGAAGSASDTADFDKLDHAVIAGLTVIGAVAGAVTGYLIGRGASKRVLVYESK